MIDATGKSIVAGKRQHGSAALGQTAAPLDCAGSHVIDALVDGKGGASQNVGSCSGIGYKKCDSFVAIQIKCRRAVQLQSLTWICNRATIKSQRTRVDRNAASRCDGTRTGNRERAAVDCRDTIVR